MAPGVPYDEVLLRRHALDALRGVGSKALGQWEMRIGDTYQIKRRLLPAEARGIGEPRDIRGTEEDWQRFEAVKPYLPTWMDAMSRIRAAGTISPLLREERRTTTATTTAIRQTQPTAE